MLLFSSGHTRNAMSQHKGDEVKVARVQANRKALRSFEYKVAQQAVAASLDLVQDFLSEE
jgi:anti-sigma28 factor (negative regulator of flagellin synthesis)